MTRGNGNHGASRTVGGYGESRLEISRSLFIGCAAQAETEQAAVDFIAEKRQQYRDATHVCSAYVIGQLPGWQRADDDGEPSGTAGRPTLEVLRKQGLTNVVAVVVRYYGGIKLGAGGLIRAYGKAAGEAVQAAGIVVCRPYRKMAVACSYAMQGILEYGLASAGYTLLEKEFGSQVTLYVLRRLEDADFERRLAELSGGTALLREAGVLYRTEEEASRADQEGGR